MLSACFNVTQDLLSKRWIAAGHDVSDGGLITAVLEMAFAGNCGVTLNIVVSESCPKQGTKAYLDTLFAEELGIVLEVEKDHIDMVTAAYVKAGLVCQTIGHTGAPGAQEMVSISVNGTVVLEDKLTSLRDIWEATSFQLERLQANPNCVVEEQSSFCQRKLPCYALSFTPIKTCPK